MHGSGRLDSLFISISGCQRRRHFMRYMRHLHLLPLRRTGYDVHVGTTWTLQLE